MSYSIDVYREKISPTKNLVAFLAFVSFFPQLVAGPIERASNLLPQFLKKRKLKYDLAVDGMRQILWGLFKKIVIADNCATFANITFENPDLFGGSTLFLGAVFFSFQIYGDFSGYSDIAIGVSRLFGFELMKNFSFPYFSRDIAEFWRRWHISLSTWFRDYVYIPLGGSRGGLLKIIRNTFIIFLLSGFWHGANWTFIAWGLLNAIYFIPYLILKRNRINLEIVAYDKPFPSFRELLSIIFTFSFVTLAWVFFRSENLFSAISYLRNIFSVTFFSLPKGISFVEASIHPLTMIILIFIVILVEFAGRKYDFGLAIVGKVSNIILRYSIYYVLIILIFIFGGKEQTFIYFQF